MFETDRIPDGWVSRCNSMDEVWVPTQFHYGTFSNSGVNVSKLVVIPEPVDVEFFDPERYEKLELSSLEGMKLFEIDNDVVRHSTNDPKIIGQVDLSGLNSQLPTSNEGFGYKFFSVFKWEKRKGWDILLKAYFKEFSRSDNVTLFLLTNAYHSSSDFGGIMRNFSQTNFPNQTSAELPRVVVIEKHVSSELLPSLYKTMDCLGVLNNPE
eukprot:TRINITY_DN954_c0_g1_i3.p1 TRINITY_DN954_c0_g1~~TRINITY_DN954_c0_g1_i3.p1  ORF type:complete len:210 (-),score=41.28 TRINITY_DN954_c0_g1_i3:404-1033(-)